MQWRYSVGFLLAGDYEAAFTCNGNDFIPLAGKPAGILVGEVTTVDFFAEDAPGELAGQVADVFFDPTAPESGFCAAEFTPAVYVFPDGVEPNFTDAPIATGDVSKDTTAEQYRYSIPLQSGDYEAAFTCNGNDFIPLAGKPAGILPAEMTTVDFLAEDAPAPVGSLSGEVATVLIEAESCSESFAPAVYVFEEGVTPNTTDGLVVTGPVTLDGTYGYLIDDLLAVTYTAAFTCTGTTFVPVDGKEAVIVIGEVTPLNFDAEDAPTPE